MLKIRLQRIGKPGHAYFRIAVLEHTSKAQGKYLELLGSYDPHAKKLQAKQERIKHWMNQGAQLTPSVNNLLITHNVIQGEKVRAWKPKSAKGGSASGGKTEAPAAQS